MNGPAPGDSDSDSLHRLHCRKLPNLQTRKHPLRAVRLGWGSVHASSICMDSESGYSTGVFEHLQPCACPHAA
eukprot:271754-Chlamydomonas_euryale.AAC.2